MSSPVWLGLRRLLCCSQSDHGTVEESRSARAEVETARADLSREAFECIGSLLAVG
jgi:hypothetical protein